MAMSDWMQSVTGRTNAEHQAWRDNYNGGWAAGDWTGNVNAGIAWERAAAGEDNPEIRDRLPAGLTPQMISGKATSNPNRGGGSSAGGSVGQGVSPSQSGAKAPTPTGARPTTGGGKITGGSASPVGQFPSWDIFQPAMKNTLEREVTDGMVAGFEYYANPWFSDVEKYWEPRGGEPGEWIGGILNTVIADPAYNLYVYGTRGVEAVKSWDEQHGAEAGTKAREWIDNVLGLTPAETPANTGGVSHGWGGGGGW